MPFHTCCLHLRLDHLLVLCLWSSPFSRSVLSFLCCSSLVWLFRSRNVLGDVMPMPSPCLNGLSGPKLFFGKQLRKLATVPRMLAPFPPQVFLWRLLLRLFLKALVFAAVGFPFQPPFAHASPPSRAFPIRSGRWVLNFVKLSLPSVSSFLALLRHGYRKRC